MAMAESALEITLSKKRPLKEFKAISETFDCTDYKNDYTDLKFLILPDILKGSLDMGNQEV
jgi:hypothetical protein